MTDLVQKLVGALEDARNQTRHPDYDWPICLLHEIYAALSEAKEGGWVAVPVEPTPEMLKAMESQWLVGPQVDMAKREYNAMLAARPLPAPPAQKEPT